MFGDFFPFAEAPRRAAGLGWLPWELTRYDCGVSAVAGRRVLDLVVALSVDPAAGLALGISAADDRGPARRGPDSNMDRSPVGLTRQFNSLKIQAASGFFPDMQERTAACNIRSSGESAAKAPARHLLKKHDRKAPNHIRGASHRCYCRYVAESSSATKRQLQQGACLVKVEPRAPRHQRRRVTVADVAEKIRFHMPFREKLLLARLTFASRKELLIEFSVIKA
jgi:hypothetical protein